MALEKKPFREYNTTDKKQRPMPVKLNETDEEMLAIGMYALNMYSKSGVLKMLARMGLEKVILDNLGMERWHYLTRGDRNRIVHEKPKLKHFYGKGVTN